MFSRGVIFDRLFCSTSTSQQQPHSRAVSLHLLKPGVRSTRTLQHCAASVKGACAAGGAGTVPLAEVHLEDFPLSHAHSYF